MGAIDAARQPILTARRERLLDALSRKEHDHTGAFHGLFMGVNRHASPAINELTIRGGRCGGADACRGHARRGVQSAHRRGRTRQTLEEHFVRLAACDEEDVVVITFSGHGSETHELVTHDARIEDLAASAIPLGHLTEWFSAIPARHLVCILRLLLFGRDGAKVLTLEARPRNLASEERVLAEMAGDGRLILTASTATQPASGVRPPSRHGPLPTT